MAQAPLPANESRRLATLTVLSIDDNPVDRDVYRSFLGEDPTCDYHLLEAETALEGLALLRSEAVDCVLIDNSLPDMDGVELLEEIHTGAAPQEIPVVMVTGADDEAVAVEIMKGGCHDYVPKAGLTPKRLLQAIANAREKVALRRELERRQAALETSRREQLELKDRLLRHVSHELRTPLAALHQFLSLLMDGMGEPAEQRQYLELAFGNANQLKRMIGDLLDVARAQSGKLRVDPRLLALPALVREVAETLRGRAAAAELRIETRLPPELPAVLADEGRTRQVIANLVENAIKFTPEGGSIRLAAGVDGDEPGFVRCSVHDTGCGIAEENARRIFDQLHQEAGQQARSREGLGLGLSICQSLVARMGGRIWVESKLGAGSSFHFTLPIFDLEALVQQALAPAERAREAGDADAPLCDGLALVRVTPTRANAPGPAVLPEPQRRRIRHLLEGLLYYPASDAVLPSLDGEGEGGVQHLIAATGRAGMGALLRRFQEHLGRDAEIKLWELRVEVVGTWLPAGPDPGSAPPALAERIEELIRSSHWEGETRHGEEQALDRG